jgi:hypothetical protein
MGSEKVNNRKKNIPRVLREKNKLVKDQLLARKKKKPLKSSKV